MLLFINGQLRFCSTLNLSFFSQVTGDSIFNLLQLGEVETGKDDRPVEPLPKILSVEVSICYCSRILYLWPYKLTIYSCVF